MQKSLNESDFLNKHCAYGSCVKEKLGFKIKLKGNWYEPILDPKRNRQVNVFSGFCRLGLNSIYSFLDFF